MLPTDLRRLALAAGLLLCLPLAAAPQVGIRNSAHDLSASSTATTRSNDPQICKFCHAPHGAQSTQLLWNHLPSAQTYNWGGRTTTLYGTQLPQGSNIGDPSKRCLACHDGTVALASLQNDGTAGHTASITFTGNVFDGRLTGAAVVMAPGGDISHNHPFSIPYPNPPSTYRSVTSSPAIPAGGYFALQSGAECQTATGICTTALAGAVDGRVVQLYPSEPGSLDTARAGLECGTCHEPHNQYGNAWLLRLDAERSSNLCVSCHQK